MNKPAVFNSYVEPSCLDDGGYSINNNTVLVATGWGLTEPFGNPSDHLVKVELDVYTDEECSLIYPPQKTLERGIFSEGMLCAGGRVQHRSTCNVSINC